MNVRKYYSVTHLEHVFSPEHDVELGLVICKGSECFWKRKMPVPATEQLLRELILGNGAVEVHVSTCDCELGSDFSNCAQREVFVDLDFPERDDRVLHNAVRAYRVLVETLGLNCSVRYSGNRSVQFVCARDGHHFDSRQLRFVAKMLDCSGIEYVDKQALIVPCHMRRLLGSLNRKTMLPSVELEGEEEIKKGFRYFEEKAKKVLRESLKH